MTGRKCKKQTVCSHPSVPCARCGISIGLDLIVAFSKSGALFSLFKK
jgi:hypothetical protein